MKRVRIGILTHNYPANSKERKDAGIFIHDFAQELVKKAEVFVFCPNFKGRKENYEKVRVTWFNWGGGKEKFGEWKISSPASILKFIKLMVVGASESLKFVRKNKLDFVLASWLLPSGVFAWYIKKRLGVPYASWSLGSDVNQYIKYPILGSILKRVLGDSDLRFANSYSLIKKVELSSKKRCDFLPAITDFKTQSLKGVKLDSGKFNFLFVGRLEYIKGPDILLSASKILKDKNIDFNLNLLGGGSLEDGLKGFIRSQNLSAFVKLHGWSDEEKVAKYMKNSDCLVISSRSESLPLVMIEAARVGLPIIATDVGDCRRIIETYNVGFIAKREDSESLSEMMLKALSLKDRFKKAKENPLRRFSSDFSQEKATEKFYNSVLKFVRI